MTSSTGRPAGRPNTKKTTLVAKDGEIPDYPKSLIGAESTPGKTAWRRIWSSSATLNVHQDYFTAELICAAIQDITRMKTVLKTPGTKSDGTVVPGDLIWINNETNLVSHPYVKEISSKETKITSWLASLAFTPSDRARLNLSEISEKSSIESFNEYIRNKRQGLES